MAEKNYSIYGDEEILDQRMAVEIGEGYVVLVTGAGGRISGLEYFSTDDNLQETMEEISHNSALIKKNYSETKVFYNLPETVLVPVGHFNSSAAQEFVDVAFGSRPGTRVNVESINIAASMVNVYRSDEHWPDIINTHFRAVTKRHLYSKLVENIVTDDELALVFYKGSFIVIAVKDAQLQLIRSFDFSSDADVLYHILNACKQVDIVLTEVLVSIRGLIDLNSSLYALLEKHTNTLLIDDAPKLDLPNENGYPGHYFTSFINLLS